MSFGIDHLTTTGEDSPFITIPLGDENRIRVFTEVAIPEHGAVRSESKIPAVDFITSVAIKVADCRNIRGMLRITEPLVGILPELI